MTKKRHSEADLSREVLLSLRDGPMTVHEIASKTLSGNDACNCGRVFVRLEVFLACDIVSPMVLKGQLFWKLNNVKTGKVD